MPQRWEDVMAQFGCVFPSGTPSRDSIMSMWWFTENPPADNVLASYSFGREYRIGLRPEVVTAWNSYVSGMVTIQQKMDDGHRRTAGGDIPFAQQSFIEAANTIAALQEELVHLQMTTNGIAGAIEHDGAWTGLAANTAWREVSGLADQVAQDYAQITTGVVGDTLYGQAQSQSYGQALHGAERALDGFYWATIGSFNRIRYGEAIPDFTGSLLPYTARRILSPANISAIQDYLNRLGIGPNAPGISNPGQFLLDYHRTYIEPAAKLYLSNLLIRDADTPIDQAFTALNAAYRSATVRLRFVPPSAVVPTGPQQNRFEGPELDTPPPPELDTPPPPELDTPPPPDLDVPPPDLAPPPGLDLPPPGTGISDLEPPDFAQVPGSGLGLGNGGGLSPITPGGDTRLPDLDFGSLGGGSTGFAPVLPGFGGLATGLGGGGRGGVAGIGGGRVPGLPGGLTAGIDAAGGPSQVGRGIAGSSTGAGLVAGPNRVGGLPGAPGVGAGGVPIYPPMAGGMGGGGAGKPEERERTTWLAEDRDVWSVDGGTAPGVIGRGDDQVDDDVSDAPSLVGHDRGRHAADLNRPAH